MTITLTPQESEEFFHNALCNAVGTGYMNGYGIRLDCKDEHYKAAEEKLTSPCLEDVWMQILRDGHELTMTDIEGEGDMTRSITMKDVHERVMLVPVEHLADMVNEDDDAITADVLLQQVFYNDQVFS